MKPVSRGIDRIEVTFDDEHLVANAGLLLVSTLAARLGIEELVNVGAGAAGEIVLHFDSGFWSNKTIEVLGRLDVRYTMAVRANNSAVARAIAAIDESDWTDIDYTPDGEAQVAECTYRGRRLIVRRTRLTEVAQARLWPHWRHFSFLSDLDGDAVALDAFHRRHAVVEFAIGDLKEGAGLEHAPPGTSSPTAPGCAVRCWPTTSSAGPPRSAIPARLVSWSSRSVRTHLIALPGRLVNRSGTPTLRGPRDWPWAQLFTRSLARVRNLQPVPM